MIEKVAPELNFCHIVWHKSNEGVTEVIIVLAHHSCQESVLVEIKHELIFKVRLQLTKKLVFSRDPSALFL